MAQEEKKKEIVEEKKPVRKESRSANKNGIWEVSLESGAIVGVFEGTPQNIAAYVQTSREGGGYYKKLEFRRIEVMKIPKEMYKTECCQKKYTSLDKYCSRCGKTLKIDMKTTKSLKLIIDG